MSSRTPTDKKTPTLGENYGLDGFPDMDYGDGVLDHGLAKGMTTNLNLMLDTDFDGTSNIPDGFITESDFDDRVGNLSNVVTTHKSAGLTDLSWLEVTHTDLDRLPKSSDDTVIPELEQAWSEQAGQEGIHFLPNVDPEVARYQESLKKDTEVGIDTAILAEIIKKAHRLNAQGKSLKKIMATVQKDLVTNGVDVNNISEKDRSILATTFKTVKSEQGLAGKVFIRASAYPDYEKGVWDKQLKKFASSARYLLVNEREKESCHYQDGWCHKTQKKVVTKVPWKAAFKHYQPMLKASGRDLSLLNGTPKQILKKAFKMEVKGASEVSSFRPQHTVPSERVSLKNAQENLKNHKAEQRVYTQAEKEASAKLSEAHSQIESWVKKGFLTKKQGFILLKSKVAPTVKLKKATQLITQSGKASEFSGIENQGAALTSISKQKAAQELKNSVDSSKEARKRLSSWKAEKEHRNTRAYAKEQEVKKRAQKVIAHIKQGLRGEALQSLIKNLIPARDVKVASKYLDPVLKKTNALAKVEKKTAKFSGPSYTAAPTYKIANIQPSERDIKRVVKWAKVKLNEGSLGKELDSLLTYKFSKGVLKAASTHLKKARNAHEGLAGNLYVDASVYASKEGTAGCEKGALKHRGNGVRSVLAMSRCGGCVFANKTEEGQNVCQKYSKPLIDSLDIENKTSFQRQAIKEANATDAEKTASLFASCYEPEEFGLNNENLEDFDYSHTPSESLEGIWFDGMADIKLK